MHFLLDTISTPEMQDVVTATRGRYSTKVYYFSLAPDLQCK